MTLQSFQQNFKQETFPKSTNNCSFLKDDYLQTVNSGKPRDVLKPNLHLQKNSSRLERMSHQEQRLEIPTIISILTNLISTMTQAIKKKEFKKQWSNYRITSLINYGSKVILNIIQER